MDFMNQLLINQVHEVPPMPAEQHIVDVEAAAAAQGIINLPEAERGVSAGAEDFLRQQTTTQESAPTQQPELSPELIRLLMMAGSESVRKLIAGSIALDVVGQQHGIDDFRYKSAAANMQTAQLEAARIQTEQDSDEEDERRR